MTTVVTVESGIMRRRLGDIPGVVECRVVNRLNRFVVEVSLAGAFTRAYINNTGRLREYLVMGRKGYCVRNPPGWKTEYRLFAIEEDGLAALIDAQMQMMFFEKAVSEEAIPWLEGCAISKRNVRLGSSLIDYLVTCTCGSMYLEVKSAVLRGDGGYAMYPDCPTLRGRRHVKTLMEHVLKGGYGAIVFIAALPHVKAFKPNVQGDPEMASLLQQASEAGVLLKAVRICYEPMSSTVWLEDPDLKVELDPGER
ncbi:MAG: sugar fermentation stimulation protein [Candidatus Bathyarchaeota archaeon B24]|nr:MAG: sugar fermentation stimulation protein [Candidatus Bathyarchaeota archaeon B24]